MHKKSRQDMWEVCLKEAVIEASMNEWGNYPSEEEINKDELPKRYEAAMRKLIKYCQYRNRAVRILNTLQKCAAIVFVVTGIGMACLLGNDEVRAECMNVMIKIQNRCIELIHRNNIQETRSLPEFGHIPAGFRLTERSNSEQNHRIAYMTDEDETIDLYCYPKKHETYIDREHYDIFGLDICGNMGTLFLSRNEQFENILLWDTADYYFVLYSSLSKDEIIKIAENLE